MELTLLKTSEVSALTRVPPETLRYWRWRNQGPRSFKIGGAVLYDRDDVLAWIDAQKATTSRGGREEQRTTACSCQDPS